MPSESTPQTPYGGWYVIANDGSGELWSTSGKWRQLAEPIALFSSVESAGAEIDRAGLDIELCSIGRIGKVDIDEELLNVQGD